MWYWASCFFTASVSTLNVLLQPSSLHLSFPFITPSMNVWSQFIQTPRTFPTSWSSLASCLWPAEQRAPSHQNWDWKEPLERSLVFEQTMQCLGMSSGAEKRTFIALQIFHTPSSSRSIFYSSEDSGSSAWTTVSSGCVFTAWLPGHDCEFSSGSSESAHWAAMHHISCWKWQKWQDHMQHSTQWIMFALTSRQTVNECAVPESGTLGTSGLHLKQAMVKVVKIQWLIETFSPWFLETNCQPFTKRRMRCKLGRVLHITIRLCAICRNLNLNPSTASSLIKSAWKIESETLFNEAYSRWRALARRNLTMRSSCTSKKLMPTRAKQRLFVGHPLRQSGSSKKPLPTQ